MQKLIRRVAALLPAITCLTVQAQYKETFIETSRAWGSAVADFNGDGRDDFIISGHDADDRVWYWKPTGYTPGSQIFDWVDRHDCDAADVNRDGRPDLYCSVGAEKGTGQGPKEIWLQDADGVFTKMPNHGAEDPFGRGRLVMFFDINDDRYPDIYLSNESTVRPDGQPNINRVFLNMKGAGFQEVSTVASGPRGFQCLAKGRLNADNYDDIVVCELGKPAHVYINDKQYDFIERPDLTPLTVSWRDAKLSDMNKDGRDDLVVLTGSNRLQVWLNNGTETFFDAAPVYEHQFTNISKSLTVGDFDRNGAQDIYVVLMDINCKATNTDAAADLLFKGQGNGSWLKAKTTQTFAACGHEAQTLDGDRVLVMNGGIEWRGPNHVLSWTP